MNLSLGFKDKIFTANNDNFEDLALELFHYQAANIPVYGNYLKHLGISPYKVSTISEIKYLPIAFFKSHKITVFPETQFYFQSSGTSQLERSRHFVSDLDFYNKNARLIFERQYGNLKDHVFFALLPSYQENSSSSLIYMVNDFMGQSGGKQGAYFQPTDHKSLGEDIHKAFSMNKKVILIGVTYALLELAQLAEWHFESLIIMETGGMKGRGEELTRGEVHSILKNKFGVPHIHSEYGMTELRSQSYAVNEGIFSTPPWMRINIRQINDPFYSVPVGSTGGVNILDLANVESCAFVETQDLGRALKDNTFEILGRLDNSETRGCNLMIF